MIEHVLRLTKGMDLKKSIFDFAIKNNIKAGYIASSVGSLLKANIRPAKALQNIILNKDLEIISLNGTVSNERIHLHISVSDEDLIVYGGHLLDDCIINTTCELIIIELEDYTFSKENDRNTGYSELVIINNRII